MHEIIIKNKRLNEVKVNPIRTRISHGRSNENNNNANEIGDPGVRTVLVNEKAEERITKNRYGAKGDWPQENQDVYNTEFEANNEEKIIEI